MVKHSFDCLFSFAKPPEIHTVEGLSAVGTDKRQKCRLCSQSRRATTCATPRYFYINFFLISLFPSLLCPPSCGSRNLFGSIMSLDIPTATPKNARFFCHRQRSRFFAQSRRATTCATPRYCYYPNTALILYHNKFLLSTASI